MADYLMIRPSFDDPTFYSFQFAQEIVGWVKEKNWSLVDLQKDEAVRQKVEIKVKEEKPKVVIFYNHGEESALIGNDSTPVIDLKNVGILEGIQCLYCLACLSGKSLGVEVWRRGTEAWMYTEVVSFTTDSLPEFQTAFNCGFFYRFIEGDSRQSTLNRAKETFTRLALELVDAGKTFAAICMREDGDALVYLDAHKPEEEEKEGCLLALLKLPKLIFFHS